MEVVLFVDGSAFRAPGGMGGDGFSVVTGEQILIQSPLPGHFSAQAAELIALTEACHLATGKSVMIYTDSRYEFGVVHDFGTLWRACKFLTSTGKHISNAQLVADLLEAILLPSKLAVCKCSAHTSGTDPVSRVNALAGSAATLPMPVSSPE